MGVEENNTAILGHLDQEEGSEIGHESVLETHSYRALSTLQV
jgi:hypothetical protein